MSRIIRLTRKKKERSDTLIAYVDGSYNALIKRYGWGYLLIDNGDIIKQGYGGDNNPDLAKMNNISGEIISAMKAIEYAISCGYSTLHLYYDYMGIEEWAIGRWKGRLYHTEKYAEFCKRNMKKIKIIFHKVKGHSGNRYNNMADELAKKGSLL